MTANVSNDQQLYEVAVSAYINYGPLFDDLDPEKFYREDNSLGVPISMELHSSINSMFRFGAIVFEDNVGLRQTLPLTGNIILTVLYRNVINAREDVSSYYKTIHFNIFNIEEVQMNEQSIKSDKFMRKGIKFHIIEAPMYLIYNGKNIGRTYGKYDGERKVSAPRIDTIIESVLLDDLNLNDKFFSLNFDKMSSEVFRVSCPYWKAQKFFKYLLEFCRDEDDNGNVKLFTNSDVESGKININLKSMISMFKNPRNGMVHPYTLVDNSTFEVTNDIAKKGLNPKPLNMIFKYDFITYDLTSLTAGGAGGKMLNYDYAGTAGYHVINDTYEKVLKESKYFGNFALWNSKVSDADSQFYYIGQFPPKVAQRYLNNRILDYKFQLRCSAQALINERVDVGDVISISFLSTDPQVFDGQTPVLDEQMSGNWLVEDIIDVVNNGVGTRNYILVKDSFFNITAKSKEAGKGVPSVTSIQSEDPYEQLRKLGGN